MTDTPEPVPKDATVIVGVTPRQPHAVLLHAANFARHFDAELVCATVDVTRYTISEHPDGSVEGFPFDPEIPEPEEEAFDPLLTEHIRSVLADVPVAWSVRALAGEPSIALAHLADTLDASLIVVGTKRSGLRGDIQEFFTGSVAVHLAHRQHRPVLVVPLSPVAPGGNLPWEDQ